ncbi:MAG: ABC transporter ATP-binding protein [Methylococcales bacterium]
MNETNSNSTAPHVTSSKQPLIQLSHVSKSYQDADRKQVIFNDLNETIHSGEFIVLMGRSGSGKSTLLNLISGIDLPDSGSVFIESNNFSQLTEEDRTIFRRHHIGFVFQAFNLIPTLTVEENLLLPLELIGDLTPGDYKNAEELLDWLGLADRTESYPDQLSGGEQQRIAVARAIIHNPMIILADEPTGNLDLETGKEVIGLLDQLVRETHKTLVMVTHSREVIGIADRVLEMHDGMLTPAQ